MSTVRSYHQFLGNGIDAVLLGPTGAMSSEAAQGVDRCYWYKADTYYPDTRRYSEGEDPDVFTAQPPGGTVFQLAPLGRAWYEVLDAHGAPVPLETGSRQFDANTGVLRTQARFANGATLTVETALTAALPALHIAIEADQEITLLAYVAPGLWPEDREWVEPTAECAPLDGPLPGWQYRMGAHRCTLRLVAASGARDGAGSDGRGAWLRLRGRRLAWWSVLACSRYPDEAGAWQRLPASPAAQRPEPPLGAISIPDAGYQQLHTFSMYMFRAMQHRFSGGLPVNNLRRAFNSHVFWDGAFVQRALLEAGYVTPAREAWRFLARTRASAAVNALATFHAPGLHWDWETTHEGERAYIPYLSQRFQVHNTPLLAHMIMVDYRATRDLGALAEGYDLLAGAAAFILHAVLVEEGAALVTRPLVGSHEGTTPVVNDGATVAASLALLRDVALASRLLGRDDDLGRRCARAAHLLRPTLASLFNGRYLQASRDQDRLNTSSLSPIYPAEVIAPRDPRARATLTAYLGLYPGRMAGHGNNDLGFPWAAGVVARILAYQGDVAGAWQQLELTRPALCAEGGCAEYVGPGGQWNYQYFSTAQAALCSALHALLLQVHSGALHLFPALPVGWEACAFQNFLANGFSVDAHYDRGRAHVTLRNMADRTRVAHLSLGQRRLSIALAAGAAQTLELGVS